MIIFIIFFILFLLILCLVQYNILKTLQLKTLQSKSLMDVYYQQRFDLIPNLVNIVKGYQKYEENLFSDVVDLRNKYYETKEILLGETLDDKLNNVIATVENYPELKASEQFLNLQENLIKVENQIQAARRIYNIDVTNYNVKINTIPYNIFAKLFSFKSEQLFKFNENNK